MKSILTILLLVASEAALAASGGEHHGGVPWRDIFWQVINLGILLVALFYLLRKPTVSFFKNRQTNFLSAAQKSQAARAEAEKQYLEIKQRLDRLEGNREEDLARAQAEAADLRKQMIKEAHDVAARVKAEAETTMNIELQRAKHELQQAFVREAVAVARDVMTKDLSAQDQQRLQGDFSKNLQAVNP